MTNNWPISENPTASKNILLLNSPILKILLVCERQLSALNISNSTKQVNVIVVSRFVRPSEPSDISRWNTHNVPNIMMLADSKTLIITDFVIIGCLTFLGRWRSTSSSTASTPSDWAEKKQIHLESIAFSGSPIQHSIIPGGPSIIILIQRICMAFNGFGIPIRVERAINDSAAIDVLNWNRTKFRMLWKIPLPSSIAALKNKTNKNLKFT